MNTDNLTTLNNKHIQDFKDALNIYEQNYSHDDLINFLKNGSIAEKQCAAIKLDSINSQSEADIFMENLTGCDGKIREAVSYRLPSFVKENTNFFVNYDEIFLDAIIDINGNICRNTIFALKYLKENKEFAKSFCEKLLSKTLPIAIKAKEFDIQEGKYKINKEIFKLYWYLETIYEYIEFADFDNLRNILEQTKDVKDYTIREKTAKILSEIKNPILNPIQQELKNDSNYYVRRL